jgi:nucleoside 2-deoxyribosyltransferase
MDDSQPKRIYLAGPEVFFPNAVEQGAEKKRLCADAGFEGIYPLDNVIDGAEHLPPQELARRISHGNERLMRSCDLLIANCTPFRSVSMDVGTAFEIGFMQALGKPVLGYSNTLADYASRVRLAAEVASTVWDCESNAAAIEDFGLAENLMIAVAIREAGGQFVTQEVPLERMLSDLTGFRRCLDCARGLSATRPRQKSVRAAQAD